MLNKTKNTLNRKLRPNVQPSKGISFPDYSDITLDNGANLLVIHNEKIPAVTVRFVFKDAGSYFDESKFGLASVTSEMLTRGTLTRTLAQIAEEIDFLGGTLASGCDFDGSFVTLSALKKHLDKALEVFFDVIHAPKFSDDELHKVTEQRIASLIQAKDDADYLCGVLFNKLVYSPLPYANQMDGTEESLPAITIADLKSFYDAYYSTSNLIIAFVGDITYDEALEIVNQNLSLKYPGAADKNVSSENIGQYKPGQIYISEKENATQSNLKVGHIGIKRNNPDFIAVTVMNTILGGYYGARINRSLREVHGYTYGARCSFSSKLYGGDYCVETDVGNEFTAHSIHLIKDELEKIVNEKVPTEELKNVQNYISGTFPLQLETANNVASRIIGLKLYGLPKNYYDDYIAKINSLTSTDILKTAQKYIHPDNLCVAISGNYDAIRKSLKEFNPESEPGIIL